MHGGAFLRVSLVEVSSSRQWNTVKMIYKTGVNRFTRIFETSVFSWNLSRFDPSGFHRETPPQRFQRRKHVTLDNMWKKSLKNCGV